MKPIYAGEYIGISNSFELVSYPEQHSFDGSTSKLDWLKTLHCNCYSSTKEMKLYLTYMVRSDCIFPHF